MKKFVIAVLLAAFAIAVPSQAQQKKPKEQPKEQPKPRNNENRGGNENRGENENRDENRGNENRGNGNENRGGNENRNNSGRRVIPNNYPRDAQGHAFNTNRFGAAHPFRFGGVGRYYAFQGRQYPEFFWNGYWFGPNQGFYPDWFVNGPSFYIILGADGNWYAVNSYDNTQWLLLYVNPDGSDTGDDVDDSDQGDDQN